MIKLLDKFLIFMQCTLIVLMVLGCMWQIFTRFVLGDASKWTEELIRYILIWMTMLGIPYAFGKGRHITIALLTKGFTPTSTKVCKLFIELVIFLLALFVMVIGGVMVTINSVGQLSPALGMPIPFYYVALPISGVLTILYCLVHVVNILNGKDNKEIGSFDD